MNALDLHPNSEPLSDGLLSTVTAASAQAKAKTLTLHNPDVSVELKYTGRVCAH